MNILNKYIINNEKFKATFSQQKSTGQLFFDVTVTATTHKELENIGHDAVISCTHVCNRFNKALAKEPVQEKKGGKKTKNPPTTNTKGLQ